MKTLCAILRKINSVTKRLHFEMFTVCNVHRYVETINLDYLHYVLLLNENAYIVETISFQSTFVSLQANRNTELEGTGRGYIKSFNTGANLSSNACRSVQLRLAERKRCIFWQRRSLLIWNIWKCPSFRQSLVFVRVFPRMRSMYFWIVERDCSRLPSNLIYDGM